MPRQYRKSKESLSYDLRVRITAATAEALEAAAAATFQTRAQLARTILENYLIRFQQRGEKGMKIKLYEYGRITCEGWKSWWSAREPSHVLGSDFIEHTDTAFFSVPDPWLYVWIDGKNGNTLRHSAEFRTNSGKDGYLTTNKAGNPVIEDIYGSHTQLIKQEDEDTE